MRPVRIGRCLCPQPTFEQLIRQPPALHVEVRNLFMYATDVSITSKYHRPYDCAFVYKRQELTAAVSDTAPGRIIAMPKKAKNNVNNSRFTRLSAPQSSVLHHQHPECSLLGRRIHNLTGYADCITVNFIKNC